MILGNMLKLYRSKRAEAERTAKQTLRKRNPIRDDQPDEFREEVRHDREGNMTIAYQLWRRIDQEVVSISVAPVIDSGDDW